MRLVRHLVLALVTCLMWAVPLCAQENTGSVSGQVIDGTTQQPLAGVNVSIAGTPRATVSRNDGGFLLTGVPAGTQRLRATRIGYGSSFQDVTVAAGQTANAQFTLLPQAAILEPVVVTGYGTQRREAITGSVSAIDANAANVGVKTNIDQMLQGRAAGVSVTPNNGEPGGGAQIRIRGGTSLSASNDPLYVVDGVPINNVQTEASSLDGLVGSPALPRNPMNSINPSDIASITILKDAAATAIYGSRAANGVVLIETKKGSGGGASIEYNAYVGVSSPAKHLDVLDGTEYRNFVTEQVQVWRTDSAAGVPVANRGGLDPKRLLALGTANTNWEREVTRSALTHNHDLAFSGGSDQTQYRASLNFMNQEGVAISSAFERMQGRLNATHHAFDNRLRLGVNITASRTNNDYLTFENTGGFEGGVFQNVAVFNPTQPVTLTDSTGTRYYELLGQVSVRNPVGLANQISDFGKTTRTLGNVSAELDLGGGLTGQLTVGADHTDGLRQIYVPAASPVGAQYNGRAWQDNRTNTTVTLQSLVTLRRQLGDIHTIDIVGGYEYSKYRLDEFSAEGRGFVTDRFSFNNLNAATTRSDSSGAEESRLVSFFSRANYGLKDRYFLTGVLRYDGSSKFAVGHKWALFPALSGSWHISSEPFMQGSVFSELRLRAGWGLQGNPGVGPYSSLLLLETPTGARYPFGDVAVGGVIPTRDPSPSLKWEQTTQYDFALDYGFSNNRFSGSVEYYVKNTKDLLLSVPVAQPAPADHRLENVGRVRNSGLEISLDAVALTKPNLTWRAGLVFSLERNKVKDLGPFSFINTAGVSGQGQSGVYAQRIIPKFSLGTFYGAQFLGVNSQGQQLFACVATSPGCVGGQTISPVADDYRVIGNANPDFTLGVHSALNWGKLDVSFLVRAAVGQDVFNNTALVYSTKSDALQDKNFLRDALTDPTGIHEPAIYSSRWVEGASFVRLQNVTVEYTLGLPILTGGARSARLFASADNLFVITGYSGLDPEVFADAGLASRGVDYLSYPRPRIVTAGMRLTF